MKKLIAIIALFLGIEANGQIVGGPVTAGSTSTLSNKTLVSPTITGSPNLKGAMTGTGSINLTGAITGASLSTPGTLSVGATSTLTGKTRVGSGTAPSATLDVTGTMSVSSTATVAGALTAQSTMSLGSANLTGGNTGTVAVLSDVVYSQWLGAAVVGGGSSPADGTSYYIGNCNAWNGAATNVSLTIPYNCTLVGYNAVAFVNGTIGSAENVTLAIQGTTNYTLTTTMTYSLGGANATSTTGISQNFTAGDLFYIRQFSPTWATNPTQIAIGITLYFVRRP